MAVAVLCALSQLHTMWPLYSHCTVTIVVVCLSDMQKCYFSADDVDKELQPGKQSLLNSDMEPHATFMQRLYFVMDVELLHEIRPTANASFIREDSPLHI